VVTILDYGINNLSSVAKAVRSLDVECQIRDHVSGATKLIIPGVGAFGAAMEHLSPLRDGIRGLAADGVPILGICLGMQLLFDASEEFGHHEGLGLIPGQIQFLPRHDGIKIPHMGWSALAFPQPSPIFEGIEAGEQVYFVHSLVARCEDPNDITATAFHGEPFTAAVKRENVQGTQFHPEKSGSVGIRILENFLRC